jgi:hypothetical protein
MTTINFIYQDKDGKDIEPSFFEWVTTTRTEADLTVHNGGNTPEFAALLNEYIKETGAVQVTQFDEDGKQLSVSPIVIA